VDWDRLLDNTLETLRPVLWNTWPANNRNEVGEATPLLHLAHALQGDGFHTAAEVPKRGEGTHIDLLAIHEEREITLAVEGKRLWNATTAASIARDFSRIVDYRTPNQHEQVGQGFASYACIIATTWKTSIREWWMASPRPLRPARCRGGGWDALGAKLAEAEFFGAKYIYEDAHRFPQTLLFAARRAPSSFHP